MKCAIALIVGLSVSFSASAACKRDMIDEGFVLSTVALVADYSTTVAIARSNGRYVEVAPFTRQIIGRHPTVGRVQKYFAANLMLNAAAQCWLPDKWRNVYIWSRVIGNGGAAINNYNIGLRFEW